MKFGARQLIIGLIALFLLSELALRLSGALNFALYRVDDGMGYIPMPNQSGSFLRIHDWVFNDRSMGTAKKWDPAAHPNILLIGNSVVMGGNSYDQKNKLGVLLQQDIGTAYSIWPVAAGGWSNVNETAYLQRNPDVVARARGYIWEYMSGGLSSLHAWPGEYFFPTRSPWCATCYALRRYIWLRIHRLNESELPPVGPIQPAYRDEFEAVITSLSHTTGERHADLIFLYPKEFEFLEAKKGKEWLADRADIEKIAAAAGVTVVDIAKQPTWNETLYRDGIHPTVEGNVVLAKILADAFASAMESSNSPVVQKSAGAVVQ